MGDLCVNLSRKGLECDYADVSGKTFDFAEWLFHKRNCQIRMINLDKEKISKKYNTIFCIDVIEHIVNPKEILRDLAGCLENNGKLIITNLNVSTSEKYPMHLEMKFDSEKYLNSLGLLKTNEPWLWVKSANRV